MWLRISGALPTLPAFFLLEVWKINIRGMEEGRRGGKGVEAQLGKKVGKVGKVGKTTFSAPEVAGWPPCARAGLPADRFSNYIDEVNDVNTTQIAAVPAQQDRAQVDTAKAFLRTLTRTKNVDSRSPYSYALKHGAENWGRVNGLERYVRNEALVAAATELGLPFRWEGDRSPNAFIGVSRASYNKALEQLRSQRPRSPVRKTIEASQRAPQARDSVGHGAAWPQGRSAVLGPF